MKTNSLAEAYKNGSIVPGDILIITSDSEKTEFIYMCYLKSKKSHWLHKYPLSENNIIYLPTFMKEDEIKQWEKMGHLEPKELEFLIKNRENMGN